MLDIESCNLCRIFSSLLLLEVVISWDGHDGILDLSSGAAVCLSYLLHPLEDHGRDLLGLEALALPVDLHDDIRLIVWTFFDFKGP